MLKPFVSIQQQSYVPSVIDINFPLQHNRKLRQLRPSFFSKPFFWGFCCCFPFNRVHLAEVLAVMFGTAIRSASACLCTSFRTLYECVFERKPPHASWPWSKTDRFTYWTAGIKTAWHDVFLLQSDVRTIILIKIYLKLSCSKQRL